MQHFTWPPPPCKRHTRPLISSAHPQYSPGGEGRGINSSSRLSDAPQGVSPPTPPLSFFHSDLQREFRRGGRTSRSRRPHQTKSQLQWRKPSLPPPHSSLSLPLPVRRRWGSNCRATHLSRADLRARFQLACKYKELRRLCGFLLVRLNSGLDPKPRQLGGNQMRPRPAPHNIPATGGAGPGSLLVLVLVVVQSNVTPQQGISVPRSPH